MKKYYIFLILFLFPFLIVQSQEEETIQWKSWEQLEMALDKEPKPVFLFFHAEWCAYCKKIQRNALKDPAVIKKLNTEYYALQMDVETTDSIYFDQQWFKNKQALTQRNGVHELPLLLASRENQSFSLPVTIVLNSDFIIQNRVFEYYTTKELLELLK